MKMFKYVCSECGSEDIEVKAWVKANSDDVVEWCEDEIPECWCNDCHEMTTFKREKIENEEDSDSCKNMAIDDYLALLNHHREDAYNVLNHLLWYLQEQGVVLFNEDKLDELYNQPNI